MLDLGFIEDVERILRMCPSGRQTALFSATMPPPIQRLAEGYMYDPMMIRITPKKLTVDAIEQAFSRSPPAQGRPPGRAAAGRGARAGDHLLPHEDRRQPPRQDAARPRARRQGAARRHEPGLARRRDDRLQGPPRAASRRHRHRRSRARHRARHPRHQLRRARQLGDLRAPDRPHRPGRAHRPRDHLRHPGPARGDRAHRARREDAIGEWETPEERLEHAPAPRRREPAERRRRAPRRRRRATATASSSSSSTAASAAASPRRTCAGRCARAPWCPRTRSRTSASCTASHSSRSTAEHAEQVVERLDGTKVKGREIRLEVARS